VPLQKRRKVHLPFLWDKHSSKKKETVTSFQHSRGCADEDKHLRVRMFGFMGMHEERGGGGKNGPPCQLEKHHTTQFFFDFFRFTTQTQEVERRQITHYTNQERGLQSPTLTPLQGTATVFSFNQQHTHTHTRKLTSAVKVSLLLTTVASPFCGSLPTGSG
jgi:hypothetical protein